MATDKVPAVYAAIRAVSEALCKEGIAKKSRNQMQGFDFRGIDAVLGTLSPLLVEHGLLILPAVGNISTREKGSTAKGAAILDSVVSVEYTLVAVADGSTARVAFSGEGMDSGDKSVSKALSIAYKMMVFQTFCVPVTGMDDPDADSPEVVPARAYDGTPPADLAPPDNFDFGAEAPAASPAPADLRCKPSDVSSLQMHRDACAKRMGVDPKKLGEECKAHFGVKHSSELTVKQITAAKVWLTRKAAGQGT